MAECLSLDAVDPAITTIVDERGEEAALPFPRSGHRIVVDDGNLYVLGGYNPDVVDEDEEDEEEQNKRIFVQLWRFNFFSREWKEIEMKGDKPLHLASHTATMSGSILLTFGGSGIPFGERSSQDVHMCRIEPWSNSVTWKRLDCKGDPPDKKYGHCQLVEWPYLYIVGGTTGYVYNCDVHCLDLRSCEWDCMFDSQDDDAEDWPDGSRYRHEMVLYDDKMYMFGGGRAFHVLPLDTVPVFDLETCEWEEAATKADPLANIRSRGVLLGYPCARRCHSCVLYEGCAYLFGGRDNAMVFSDLWRLKLDTLQWTHIPLRKTYKCCFHHAAVTSYGCMYLFGGVTQSDGQERSNKIHKIWLDVPSLQELAWQAFSTDLSDQYHDNGRKLPLSHDELLDIGVPREFVHRLPS